MPAALSCHDPNLLIHQHDVKHSQRPWFLLGGHRRSTRKRSHLQKIRSYLMLQSKDYQVLERNRVLEIHFVNILGIFQECSSNLQNIPRICTLLHKPPKNTHLAQVVQVSTKE